MKRFVFLSFVILLFICCPGAFGEEKEYSFVDNTDLGIGLIRCADADEEGPGWFVEIDNRMEDDISVSIEVDRIDDAVTNICAYYFDVAGKNTGYRSLREISRQCALMGLEGEIELQIGFTVVDRATWKDICRIESTVVTDGDQDHMIVWKEILGNRAEEQCLLDDENMLLLLKGAGHMLGSDHSSEKYLRGLVYAENRMDKDMPFDVTGVRINGQYFGCRSSQGVIAPGGKGYRLFEVKCDELINAGIRSIDTMELLLYTDDEQNMGTYLSRTGGEYYPVRLQNVSNGENDTTGGETVLEWDGMEICYLGVLERRSYTEGTGYVSWAFQAVNRRNDHIKIKLLENSINQLYFAGSFYGDIAAGSAVYFTVGMNLEDSREDIDVPIGFGIYTMGGGKLLHREENVVRLISQAE